MIEYIYAPKAEKMNSFQHKTNYLKEINYFFLWRFFLKRFLRLWVAIL